MTGGSACKVKAVYSSRRKDSILLAGKMLSPLRNRLRSRPSSVDCSSEEDEEVLDYLSVMPRDLLVMIESNLSVNELLALTLTSKTFCDHLNRQETWRNLFRARWGDQYAVNTSTRVSPSLYSMLSSTTFWNTVEKAFLLAPSISRRVEDEEEQMINVPRAEDGSNKGRRHLISYATTTSNRLEIKRGKMPCSWKIAFLLQERGNDLVKCRVCNQLDALGAARSRWDAGDASSTQWVVPCACAFSAHRHCVEKKLAIKRRWFSLGQSPIERAAIFSEPLGHCMECGAAFKSGLRLPSGIIWELAGITWTDASAWRHLCVALLYWIAAVDIYIMLEFFTRSYSYQVHLTPRNAEQNLFPVSENGAADTSTLTFGPASMNVVPSLVAEDSFSSLFTMPPPILLWYFFQQSILLNKIFFSSRFASVVERVWRGPIFGYYCKMYAYFVFASTTIFFIYSPLLERLWIALFGIDSLRDCLWFIVLRYVQTEFWGQILGALHLLIYFVVSSTVILIFWKTNYRVITLAGRKGPARAWSHQDDNIAWHVLNVLDMQEGV